MTNDRYLFRGFHKDKNGKETIYLDGEEIKGNWVYGNHIYDNTTDKHYIDLSISEDETDSNKLYIYAVEVIPKTVGQYTGLDDKNSKKIFENDVCKAINTFGLSDEDVIGKVSFKLFDGLELKISDENMVHFDYLEEIEVIGTIFDKEVSNNV